MTTRGVLAKLIFLLLHLMPLFSQHRWLPVVWLFVCFVMLSWLCWSCVTHLLLFLPSRYWSHFIVPRRDRTSDGLESCPVPFSRPPFIPCATGISSWLIYTFWKLSCHSWNIARHIFTVYYQVNFCFCRAVNFWVLFGWVFFVPCKLPSDTVGFLTCFSFPLEQKSVMLRERDLSSPQSHEKHRAFQCLPVSLSRHSPVLLKPEHQRSKGTCYMPGYQLWFPSSFLLYALPMYPQSTSLQNTVSIQVGNLVPQLDILGWVLAWCRLHHFVILLLVWSSRKNYNELTTDFKPPYQMDVHLLLKRAWLL